MSILSFFALMSAPSSFHSHHIDKSPQCFYARYWQSLRYQYLILILQLRIIFQWNTLVPLCHRSVVELLDNVVASSVQVPPKKSQNFSAQRSDPSLWSLATHVLYVRLNTVQRPNILIWEVDSRRSMLYAAPKTDEGPLMIPIVNRFLDTWQASMSTAFLV